MSVMGDESEDDDIIDKLKEEVESWKLKYKSLELKKRESDLALNKIKTEINSLRSVDKQWKDSAKAVFYNLNDVKEQFDTQMDQVILGMAGISKAGERITAKIPYNRKLKTAIVMLQNKIVAQEETIMALNGKIRVLTSELQDKALKVERLSQGIEEEVDRLIRPMRDKLADCMVALMKERAARAQDRRECADLWPADHLLPSMLMRYRSLTDSERERRRQLTLAQDASFALTLEVRANVVESRSWEVKYDDYGRAFFQHVRSGEVSWEAPDILQYKPPPGRDEMGNLLPLSGGDAHSDDMANWTMKADNKGQVYFEQKAVLANFAAHGNEETKVADTSSGVEMVVAKATPVITYLPPYAYRTVPKGKSKEVVVGEAAALVLTYIREKISRHIERTKRLKARLENPPTAEELKRKEKEDRNKSAEERAAEEAQQHEEEESIALGEFQYDIETVELLAASLGEAQNRANADKDPEAIRAEKRAFLADAAVRSFDPDLFLGKTLAELDLEALAIPQLRGMVEELALAEEKLEAQVGRVRSNLKDFSFALMEKVAAHDQEAAAQAKLDAEAREKERRAQVKAHRMEQKKALAEEREAKRVAAEEAKALAKQQQLELQAAIAANPELAEQLLEQDRRNSRGQLSKSRSNATLRRDSATVVPAAEPQLSVELSFNAEGRFGGEGEHRAEGSVPHLRDDGDMSSGYGSEGGEGFDGDGDSLRLDDRVIPAAPVTYDNSDDEAEALLAQAHDREDQEEAAAAVEAEERAARPVDYGSILFGEPRLTESEPDCSPEMLLTTANLVSFAVFCGYCNLHPGEAPHDSNAEYSLQADYLVSSSSSQAAADTRPRSRTRSAGASGKSSQKRPRSWSASSGKESRPRMSLRRERPIAVDDRDDEWLSSSLFVAVSKESLDPVRQALSQTYDPGRAGLLSFGPLDTEVLVHESAEPGVTFERSKDAPYTPATTALETRVQQEFREWKAGRLLSDVVRRQIQKQAVTEAQVHRMQAFEGRCGAGQEDAGAQISCGAYYNSRVKLVQLRVLRVTFDKRVPFAAVTENLYYVRLGLGAWTARTHSLAPTPHEFVWSDFTGDDTVLSGALPVNDLQIGELAADLLDENPASPERVLVARGALVVSRALGGNLGREMMFACDLLESDGATVAGKLSITLVADFDHDSHQEFGSGSTDPQGLDRLEVTRQDPRSTSAAPVPITMASDATPRNTASEAHRSSFVSLVGDLRGDGVDFVRRLVGDVTTVDLAKAGHTPDPDAVERLPNFAHAKKFLSRKVNMHRSEVAAMTAAIDEFNAGLDAFMAKKFESATKQCAEMRTKHRKLMDTADDLKKEVLRVQKLVLDNRRPNPSPREPALAELPRVAYVPKLPVTGALDGKGKKKKQIPANDLKALLDRVEAGELDGVEIWPYPEANWPSQAQQLKLGKALASRNAVLDRLREAELESRAKLVEAYQSEMAKWELLERRRQVDLGKSKRDCRKINLRFEYHMERANRVQKEYQAVEGNASCVRDLMALHAKAKDRFRLMRFKQQLELARQEEFLEAAKRRLLRALNARRHALDMPSAATDRVHFEALRRRSEEALRMLTLEIFECKQSLVAEGARLRTLFQEEVSLCQSELARAKISREILSQRDCFDKILERYKYEVLSLMADMERLRIAESEKDEVGVDTVDDLGEKYVQGKVWASPEIAKCQRLVDVCMAKINLTEGLGGSTIQSQRAMLDVLATKWGADFLPLRDSWVEHSDFDRAQQLLADTVQWVARERSKLMAASSAVDREKLDLGLQLEAMREQGQLAAATHELETSTINRSSTEVISVMRAHLDEYRVECGAKIDRLETSIVDLSRECQKVREELLAQEMLFDEKTKVLWAFIHTLQTAVQQLSVRMEMVLEEREQIVIKSKLVADRMRHQLRIERRHCSNLMFIIHSQRGFTRYLHDVIQKLSAEASRYEDRQKLEKSNLRKEIWEQLFCFTRLCTDVDALFDFFAERLANLAGSRASINNALAQNNAAMVLSALCKSPRPLIRKCAARALGGMGWDGFVETRILLWDCVMYWKAFKARTLARESKEFAASFDKFAESHKEEAILTLTGEVEEFVPAGNMSLRTIIKQRRQWALRAARRSEGPNVANQRLLNIKDGVIPSLLEMSLRDGAVDWEIARNAALAISIASYEPNNHHDMTHNELCVRMIIDMCRRVDAEVQTHAAVTVANLCHRDEAAQLLFGKAGAIPALVAMLHSGIVDVLEAATSALANITCYCDANCQEVLRQDGVRHTVRVITQAYSENLLDLDQNDEVQANAAEMLANVSRFSTEETVGYFDGQVVVALVLMCASQNKQLRRHIPLVLGNIAQSEACRYEVGVKGGIEALFLVLEDADTTIQANALWALCNLMWHPPNQERAGRFMSEITQFLSSEWEPVRTHASTLLANVLYYNNTNRVRFLESDGAIEQLLGFVRQRADVALVEGSLRALLSLSYLDSVAMWLGVEAQAIPLFISYLLAPHYSRESMRYSLEIICNLCLHHANRRIIFDSGGVDAIVSLHIDDVPHIRDLSVAVIRHLEDITPPEVMARAKADIGLERMVLLATSSDPLVRAVAAESIGEEIWADAAKQQRAHAIGGVDALLGIIANAEEPVESALPALWSLRNVVQNNAEAQTQLGYRDGLSVVSAMIRRALVGQYAEQTEKVFEGALACLVSAVLNHDRNSRKLLMVGLDAVMDLADGGSGPRAKAQSAALSLVDSVYVGQALRSEGVVALAKSLLLMLGPYNYVVCRNCQRKQDLHGTTCYNCGYRLLVEVDPTDAASLKVLGKITAAKPSLLSAAADPITHKGGLMKRMSTATAATAAGAGATTGGKHTSALHRHLASSASLPAIPPMALRSETAPLNSRTSGGGDHSPRAAAAGDVQRESARAEVSARSNEARLSQTMRS